MQNIELINITRDRPDPRAFHEDVKPDKRLMLYQTLCGVLIGVVAVQTFFIWVLQAGPI